METKASKIARLRIEVEAARTDLIEAEAELADYRADVEAFEFIFAARMGERLAELAAVEAEVADLLDRIQRRRNEQTFGTDFRSVDEQYRRTWQQPPKAAPKRPSESVSESTEVQIKKLYRQLARRLHPDLTTDAADRVRRTELMTAVNDAYAARSLAELLAVARQLDGEQPAAPASPAQTEDDMVRALEEELIRCRRRLRRLKLERQTLHTDPMVALSLEVKLAQRQGRDLLGEMVLELERKIARKQVERDMIQAQFESLQRPSSSGPA
ncbi:MAG: J domain-containing protein [Ardenticatenaceae bacterium]|nr:J domain-containing protein [Ardenticatenaceae bacterium]